jgi:transposase-like protein
LRDVEELLEERGLEADHTTVWRWVQRYAPELEQRMRCHLKPTNKSWRCDETYIKVKGRWCYLYRAIDSTGATIRFSIIGQAGCQCRQTAVSQGSQHRFTSAAARHQYRSGADLHLSYPGY